tara:strand:- start:749 stop:1885 length:1137 start_codon:yes stop_codon:yes gene_type:complete
MDSLDSKKLIRLSKSCINEAEKKAVMKVLDAEFLGMGIDVNGFEKSLSNYFERDVVCVSTGTAALQLALQAAGIGKNDEVLVQSLTYVATFQAISATGAKPIACDIDPFTFCIDIKDTEKRITKNTKAIMPVHYCGGVGDIEGIYSFAEKYNLRVIEDAAHAFGTTFKNKRIGSFGDIACFSFDGIKNITSGEGGCIVTNDKKVSSIAKDVRLLGVEKDTEKRYSGRRSWDFDVKTQGWRYHMSNIMAAIGSAQLSNFNFSSKKRQELAKHYVERLKNCHEIKLIPLNYDDVVPHIFVVELLDKIDRDRIRKKLSDKNIQTGIHYKPNHWLTYYKNKKAHPLPNTDRVFGRLLTLPLHTDLEVSDVDEVCNHFIDALI